MMWDIHIRRLYMGGLAGDVGVKKHCCYTKDCLGSVRVETGKAFIIKTSDEFARVVTNTVLFHFL